MILVATGANDVPVSAPAGWNLAGTRASTAMVTSVWSRIATSADPGQKVTVSFGSAYRKGNLQLLAYSGASASTPVEAFASTSSVTTALSATTPSAPVAVPGSWELAGWAAKSAAVTSWTTAAGQVVRDASYGPDTGTRIDMIITDIGTTVPVGSAGGTTASTDQPAADTTWTLVLAPGS
jgi:hypothetical protein